jgi:uncharacterized membrane protein YedE/YeeE
MENFTPLAALAGGLMIGAASLWLLAGNGRIAGISGILHGLAVRAPGDTRWRAWFIAGLLAAGFLWHALGLAPVPRAGFGLGWAIAAGFLVGVGTRMSSGCTSGHGICGLGRLSVRSLVAVAVFMATGAVAVFVVRHVLGVAS